MRNDANNYYNDFCEFFANGYRAGGVEIGTMNKSPFEHQLLMASIIFIRRDTNFNRAFEAVVDAATNFYTMIENKASFLAELNKLLERNNLSADSAAS
jgi:hypothetical protein